MPFTSLGHKLGFAPLPLAFFLFFAGATRTYLVLIEIVKRRLMRRLLRDRLGVSTEAIPPLLQRVRSFPLPLGNHAQSSINHPGNEATISYDLAGTTVAA